MDLCASAAASSVLRSCRVAGASNGAGGLLQGGGRGPRRREQRARAIPCTRQPRAGGQQEPARPRPAPNTTSRRHPTPQAGLWAHSVVWSCLITCLLAAFSGRSVRCRSWALTPISHCTTFAVVASRSSVAAEEAEDTLPDRPSLLRLAPLLSNRVNFWASRALPVAGGGGACKWEQGTVRGQRESQGKRKAT